MKIRSLTGAVALAGMVLTACGSGGSGGTAANAAGGTAGAAGKANPDATVTIGLVLEPGSLDITKASGAAIGQVLLNNVYQGLLQRDDKGAVTPALATSYQVSHDGKTYTFTLRDNVTFQDGSPLRAADVVASLNKVIAPGSVNPNASDLASVASVAAPDAKTVVLTLKDRDTNLTYRLTGAAGAVIREGATDLDSRPVGTGPFRFDSWRRGDSITLVRNDQYWGTKAGVTKVVFRYITDPNAQNNAVKTGQVDIGTIAESELVNSYQGNPNFVVVTGTSTDKFILGVNHARTPLSDARVRHAIRQGINKDGLIKILGGGTRIGSSVPPLDPWYEDLTGIDRYDPANARKLLADAGYAGGLNLTLTVANIYPPSVSEYVRSQLQDVGITVKITSVEFPTWLTQVYKNADYDLSIVDHAEPRDLGNYAKPGYYWRYDSPAAQQDYRAAVTASSDAERDQNLRKLARQISEDAASDWLLLGPARQVARVGVTGFPTNNLSSLYDASKIEARKS
ncbi:ABC transporter periplasmic protein [Candidatus Protofrankia californiensis]|uniref:ABC transporter periplasmic protein n=1 Tax=Candidatus Protofrankia californiensis TaxID=1839754 RepID=A0A1C3PAG2_9ACTN|nr:ABC transporter periplasmic protein [Candidatus Protofrankia californiensis]